MASFSDSLKASKISMASEMSNIALTPSIMTLDETAYDGLAYSGETWTADKTNYRWFNDYVDENYSFVDDKKNIVLNEKQFQITQEENSQFIPFEIPRYYDGIDLSKNALSIHYDRSDKQHGSSIPVNVQYSTDKIRFAWLADPNVTGVSGNLTFEIHADGFIKDSNGTSYAYTWKTKSNSTLEVLQSICGTDCGGVINVDDSWVQDLVTVVAAKMAEQFADEEFGAEVEEAKKAATDAQTAAEEAKTAVANAKAELTETVTSEVNSKVSEAMSDYYTKQEVDDAIKSVDVSEQLQDYALKSYVDESIANADISDKLNDYALKTEIPIVPENVSAFINDAGYLTEHQSLEAYALKSEIPSIDGLATETYVQEELKKVDVSEQLTEYVKSEDVYTKTEVDEAIKNVEVDLTGYATEEYVTEVLKTVDVTEQLEAYAKSEDVYTKEETYSKDEIDSALRNVEPDFTGYATEEFVDGKILPLSSSIANINETLESIDKSPNAYYTTTYNQPYTVEGTEYTGENTLVVYEIYNKDTENETRTVVSSHVITGGSGGSTTSNIIKIERVTETPVVVTSGDKVIIEYNFIGTDSSGEDIGQGNVTWKVGNKVVKTETVYTGLNSVDITEFLSVTSDQKVTLTITDDIGTMQQKIWYVSVVDVKLESGFNDTRTYPAGSAVNITYTPYGAVDKTIHFLLDGKEIGTKTSNKAAAGLSDSYSIPAQTHGTHLFEMYMTATINNNDIESNHIIKDIIWYDESSDLPVIGCVHQNFTARQYEATNIVYTVYDPNTETPNVTLRATYVDEDGDTVEEYNSNIVMSSNTDTWQYKTSVIGKHTLTITCGKVTKKLIANITELGIEIVPITAGLAFDFNPVGYSNNDENRLWKYNDTGIGMSVSDNFDWKNGGYQLDSNGDQCFCIKAGTSAEINYELFADDAKANGKQMKLIFKTSNVADSETTFLECLSDTIGTDKIGIEMKVSGANIYAKTENPSLPLPYAEEEIIEFEFNITASSETIPMVLGYEDGVPTRPMVYDDTHDFQQRKDYRKTISLGSPDCDLYIYRFKVYNTSLSDKDILNNFIADARSAEEMIARYDRNQIYKEGVLDPEYLAEMCPDLRIIKIDCPRFTKDKDDKVGGTTIECIYKNGDPVLDNWIATDCVHAGRT